MIIFFVGKEDIMPKVILLAAMAGIAGCASTMSAAGRSDLIAAWTIEFIGERPVIDNSTAYINLQSKAA